MSFWCYNYVILDMQLKLPLGDLLLDYFLLIFLKITSQILNVPFQDVARIGFTS